MIVPFPFSTSTSAKAPLIKVICGGTYRRNSLNIIGGATIEVIKKYIQEQGE
ncbi:sugar phosphate isomerase family [Litchfieldia alkalitelluris]|uniref:hypothetical protein n=1 Tax=Litchfieldia alkalitelluris TaxID=304268 RepID=UPI00195E688A|nr:hypothetical protein [Litchfieldia alkalitelluris]